MAVSTLMIATLRTNCYDNLITGRLAALFGTLYASDGLNFICVPIIRRHDDGVTLVWRIKTNEY